MKLQVALDEVDIGQALAILGEVHDVVDIIEVGTPLIVKEGVSAVSEIRHAYPDMTILADLKIVDGGEYESLLALDAGADIVTVLGAADDITILECAKAAHSRGKKVLVDMIGVKNVAARVAEIDGYGVDYICAHTADDVQAAGVDKNPLSELQLMKSVAKSARLAVAGGIRLSNVDRIAAEGPEIVIVGGGIVAQSDRRRAALELRRHLEAKASETLGVR